MTSLRGGGPMTTLVVADHEDYGAVLWGRLWPNVETREQIEGRASDVTASDNLGLVFPWLAPTRTSNPKAGGRKTTQNIVHPLQVYWGMPRRIRLRFENAQDGILRSHRRQRILLSPPSYLYEKLRNQILRRASNIL